VTSHPKRVIIYCRVSDEEQAIEGKASIPDQLARQRDRAEANGWQIVDTIIIEGFSGRHWTYLEFSQKALAHGFADPMRMWGHWERRDFDILSCRDMSRLGREQSIISEVVGRTIEIGAIIAPLDEGTLDATNHRLGSAFSGIGASQQVDNLIRYHEMGMIAKASRGGKLGNKPPPFYIEVFDPTTLKATGIKPDRDRFQRLFDDFVTAYCNERIPYERLGRYLYEHFGHIDPKTNKPYTKYHFMRMLFNAATWGHLAYGRYRSRGQRFATWGNWITGDAPPPEDVKFFPNIVEPIWTSPTLEQVKTEFNHRHFNMIGRMANRTKYMFSGLCKCALCGAGMASYTNHTGVIYYRCGGRYGGARTDCANSELTPEHELVKWLTPILELWQSGLEAPPAVIPVSETEHIELIDKEITDTKKEIKRLMGMIDKYGETSNEIAEEEIKDHNARIKILMSRRAETFSFDASTYHKSIDQKSALEALQQTTLEHFWELEPYTINQWLFRLFGKTRISILHRHKVDLFTPVD